MKVIKRDGRAVDFDRSKIEIAIEKANNEVRPQERASKDEIKAIIQYVMDLDKKRILVEDIQDIIEERLMDLKHFELAKKYMIYRYTRALVRKANSTDQSILGLIKNQNKAILSENPNKNSIVVSTQRDLIAGEVSKDLTKRILLPEKISKAHDEGILQFHDADYFLQPIFNCSYINIGDMLDNGTVMNGKLIETPKSFQVACTVVTQIMAAVSSSQYGGQSVDVSHLGKYLKKSYEKFLKEIKEETGKEVSDEIIEKIAKRRLKSELSSGIQTIQYQINTLMTANGQSPFVTLFLHLDKDDPYIKENAMIIEEILSQKLQGIKNEEGEYVTTDYPKLVYVLDENNNLTGGEYDYLTKLAIKCSAKRIYPDYISSKIMRKNFSGNVFSPIGFRCFLTPWKDKEGNYKFEGRFNQGVVSINLPQIALVSDGDEKKFWSELDERLKLCYEALMCKHYALLGTISDASPIHWKDGGIARLKSGERIDELLKDGYSTLSLGYIGIYETTKIMKGVSHTTKEGHDFAIKLIKKLRETTDRWKKDTGLGFTLYGTPVGNLRSRFAEIDRDVFGTIKDVTDKGYYTNSYHVDDREEMDIFQKLKFESEFQTISSGGAISYVDIKDIAENEEKLEELIKYIYENIQYVELIQANK